MIFTRILLLCMLGTTLILGCVVHRNQSTSASWDYEKFKFGQHSFLSEDGMIKYIDRGEGRTVLLLHGVPTSSWLYRKMIDDLVVSGCRVIAPDMLGYGNSDNPAGYELYSSANHAKRILALMEYLEIYHWTQVAHDAGGLWTWELFNIAPNKIDHLILLNSIIFEEGFNPPIRMKPGLLSKISMWMYRNTITNNLLIHNLFYKGLKENKLTKAEELGYIKPLLDGKTKAMYYFFSQTCNLLPDYTSVIRNIDIPVAIIWGKQDKMLQWSPQGTRVIEELSINSADVHLLDAQHFIQEEMPQTVDSLILNFINLCE